MDASVRRNEQKGVLIAGVLSPTLLPFSLPPYPLPLLTPATQATNQLIFSVLIFYKAFGDLEKVIASRPIDFSKKFISLPVD